MRWILSLVVIVALIAAAWFLRGPLMGLFFSTVPDPTPAQQSPQVPTTATYASSTLGYSFEYPTGYTLNESYKRAFGATKSISGVSVTVGTALTQGTNLSNDTHLAVEQLPRATTCTADIFILDDVKAATITDNGLQYSVATSSGAGAGNVYEEMVYALPGSKPCTAVRYQIHTTNIANYPEGEVQEYDRGTLLRELDTIRRSLKLIDAPEPAAATSTPAAE